MLNFFVINADIIVIHTRGKNVRIGMTLERVQRSDVGGDPETWDRIGK